MSPTLKQIVNAITRLEKFAETDLDWFLVHYLQANIEDIFIVLMMDYDDAEELALDEPTIGPYHAILEDK